MRFTIFATALVAAITFQNRAVVAFEAEDEMIYSGSGAAILRIISTTDIDVFEPLVTAFQRLHPDLTIQYVQASSTNVFTAITNDTENFDIAISSAMDLQTKAANDGYVRGYNSTISAAFPAWSKLRDQVFGFTQEPAVLVASKVAFDGLKVPKSRPELIEILRANPDRFRGKIGTYDVRISGLGYLFATQDARQSDGFWRLAEVIGALSPKLYCCSSSMIEAIEKQEILLAYNVLGPYAQTRINVSGGATIIPLTDYTNIMMRSVLIPEQSTNPVSAGQFIDFLLGKDGRILLEKKAGLPPLVPNATENTSGLRPIRLGPGLLVYLDQLKRKRFLADWEGSFLQK
jgi:iron(III) transport system substrate-binding protein